MPALWLQAGSNSKNSRRLRYNAEDLAMHHKAVLWGFLIYFGVCSGYVFSQEIEEAKEDVVLGLTPNTQLALSTPDYLVTPGDIYTLAYLAGGTAVEYSIVVDSSYRIRVSNLGTINAVGKTFNQLKTQVERVVTNNYPLGGVQFILKQPGTFRVYLKGEVQTIQEISTWALARLSTLLSNHLTNYSSIRNVTIKSLDGQVKVYDLFKANRFGDLSQNPYVRPEDTIIVSRIDRRVTIKGAVERPGTYQLLAGENLKDVIELYGNGFTALAVKSKLELIRYVESLEVSGDKIYLTKEDFEANYTLYNLDSIMVPSITDLRPTVPLNEVERRITIDGAVRRPGTYQLMPGENLKELIEVYADGFTPLADKACISLVRVMDSIAIWGDIYLLTEDDVKGNYSLVDYDIVTVSIKTSREPYYP
jgi:protein involved in polysaccharide export with SLBB domain